MGKTSLERSHSGVSNFKLTMLALFAIISFNAIFVGLALYNAGLLSMILHKEADSKGLELKNR